MDFRMYEDFSNVWRFDIKNKKNEETNELDHTESVKFYSWDYNPVRPFSKIGHLS